MNNQYILLRHGQSISNINDIVISTIENGVKSEYGLTKLGVEQITITAKNLAQKFSLENIIIITSPFKRTVESALIIKDLLKVKNENIAISTNLVERNFSRYELQKNDIYEEIWENDSNHKDSDGVESCQNVFNRIKSFIEYTENSFKNKIIIVISHGDTIMIARTYFENNSPYNQRNFPYINNAEYLIYK
jgi:broad specificity phosphatase PhoE